jgi:pheromone shutdown-related protein TraB
LIGSSHISKDSINEIKKAFTEIKPDILAVELDRNRAEGLMSNKKGGRVRLADIKRIGVKGFVFAMLGGWVSKKLGKIVGVMPGSEMKAAMKLAKESSLNIEFIDQHIEITLKRFSKTLTWKEKWHFVADIFNGLILRKKDPLLNFDLSKVPEKKIIRILISRLKERYPNIHKVLIEERNYFMARKIKNLMASSDNKKILAVVGAGHEEEIIRILKENEGISYSYSFTHKA